MGTELGMKIKAAFGSHHLSLALLLNSLQLQVRTVSEFHFLDFEGFSTFNNQSIFLPTL